MMTDAPKFRINPLIDQYHRRMNYLRVSITDRCNLECLYCVPRNLIQKLPHDQILRYEEILRVVGIGIRLGIQKIRVTGGEPLVRKGVDDFLERLTHMEGVSDVSLTTNGVFLLDHVARLQSAGIRRINVSLDTLDRGKYRQITGHDHFDQVWEGILAAEKSGIHPIKINVVALEGINDDEIVDIAGLSFSHPFHIRFIEYMPIGPARRRIRGSLLVPNIKARLGMLGPLTPLENGQYDGPAQRFRFEGACGEIGFISAMSHHFCKQCNRLRLTADGQLRACLLSDRQEDLKGLLRAGRPDEDLEKVFFRCVRNKPAEHHMADRNPPEVTGQMCAIGG